ncbi:hypothetical protein EBME_1275 [bacterium endosymbiont of Mortierella elongata FMR23-6]|nr:hypothetical protein EBME_1275 [bacterium endosymbiont of Mortierella elongata FMR23-6]
MADDYHQQALAYQKQGNETKAEEQFRQALAMGQEAQRINPKKSKVYRTLAVITLDYADLLERQHRTTEAKDAYQQAQEYADEAHKLEPKHPKAQDLLRTVNSQRSQFLRAEGQTAQADNLEGKIVVQNCQGTINAPVHGKNNTVNVHYYSPDKELLPQIQEMHTAVGELKTAYLDRFKEQQALELRWKKEPLAILGRNIEEEYFTAWEEPGEIQDGLAMYVAPQATTLTDKDTLFDLDEAVTAFLTQGNDSGQKTQVLLLCGEAGSGKSTFNRHLARRLWQDYSKASGERPIPLYISLPTIDRPNKNLIGQYLSDKCGFSPEQIDALRASQSFILILDGYDEIPAEQRNLYADEKLDQWQAKILLSCRPEYLTDGYKNHLQPRGRSRVLLEYQLAPFSEQSVETYIHQYVKHTQAQWSAEDYQDRLAQIPNVKELLGTPFLLKMALSVLPTLEKPRPAQRALTRIKLYEQFVQTWFERSLARLDAIQSKLMETEQKAFRGLKDEGFIEHSQTFNTQFALEMSKAQTTVAEYSPIASLGKLQDKRYKTFLSNKDEAKNLLRFSALLTRQQQQYRFIHKSIQDYLVARAIWEELENFPGSESSNRSTPLNWVEQVRVLWEGLSPSVQVDATALLNTFNVVEDLAIQRFLVERVQQNGGLLKPLLAWIKASTRQNSVSMAAANAITILIKAGVQFHEADLKGVQIPGADLSFGVFDSAQLQGADLRQVNFRNSWLRDADLSAAKMAGVQFGEWAYLQEESEAISCAYSPDGNNCAVGLYNGTISIYLTSNWEKIYTLEGHIDSVRSVMYSPNGSQIASGSDDKTVRLWNAQSGVVAYTLEGHTLGVTSVVYSLSGSQIASGSADKTVRLWDTESGAAVHTLKGHTDWVTSVMYSPNGLQVASSSRDKTVRLWGTPSGAAGHTLEGHTDWVTSVVYSPSGLQLASGSWDKTVRLWDTESSASVHTLGGHTAPVTSVVYSPSGSQIASGSEDTTVRLWSAESGVAAHTLEGHTKGVTSVAYSPGGSQIASASNDKMVRLWDTESGLAGHTLEGHTKGVTSVAYSPSGSQIASGSFDNTVRLWSAESGMAVHTLEGHIASVTSVVYSPGGSQLASGGWDSTVRLWDVESGVSGHILEGHTHFVTSVVYSPSGLQIASGSWDDTVRLWEVASGDCLRVIQEFRGTVYSVAWKAMPEGSYLLTGSGDKIVRQWSIREGDEEWVRLIWMSPHAGLTVEGALIEGVEGLSEVNRALLTQRGANDGVVLSDLA